MGVNKIRKIRDKTFLLVLPLAVTMLFILFPFYWTLVTAFKREGDILQRPAKYLPNPWTLDNFKVAWSQVGFSTFFKNSLFIAVVTCFLIVVLSLLVGYALSRFQFRGKKSFMLILLFTQFIPGAMLIIPLFIIFNKMHLINTYLSLIIVYATFNVPFNSILMRGFVSTVPFELEEAAYVDGCGKLRAIFLVVLPVLVPAIVATAAFAFISCWNEFLYALMFINDNKLFTIPIGLSYMQGEFDIKYGALAAGSVIALIPALILFSYVQKHLVGGLSSGAVKG
jgi:multiple sugar transport system permease protein